MDLLDSARELRRDATDAEKLFWRYLRNRQLAGFKFRRQVPKGNYIVDVLCEELRLVVELDGGQPSEAVAYDQRRTQYLEKSGYRVIRFWNHDVLQRTDSVLEALTLAECRTTHRERELHRSS